MITTHPLDDRWRRTLNKQLYKYSKIYSEWQTGRVELLINLLNEHIKYVMQILTEEKREKLTVAIKFFLRLTIYR